MIMIIRYLLYTKRELLETDPTFPGVLSKYHTEMLFYTTNRILGNGVLYYRLNLSCLKNPEYNTIKLIAVERERSIVICLPI